jgi:mevalonate kinase
MSTACAPGKIILLGEHAVVYGRPALAVPVRQVQACATVEPAASGPTGSIEILAPDLAFDSWLHDLPRDHPLASICRATLAELAVAPFPPLRLTLNSTIPVASGLGSSAAVSVAVARALVAYFGGSLSDQQVSDLAFEVERIHHGTPSGIDNTVVAFDRAVIFQRGESPQTLKAGGRFLFLIGDTGVPAPTAEAVGLVRQHWTANRDALESVFDQIADLVLDARQALQQGLPERLGGDLGRNHELLQALRVSSPDLDRLVQAADGAGALGAKMSGGGMGGNMIALVAAERREAIADALRRAGATGVIETEVGP